MHLLIVHYHWRPGGVRQVVQTALPALVADPRLDVRSVTLAAGHPPPAPWAQEMETAIGQDVPLRWLHEPLFGYASEWPGGPADHRHRLTDIATRLLHSLPEPRIVLLENPAVGRHPLLGRALADACAATGTHLICHHHDFFLDGRWERWPDWVACGHRSLQDALDAAVPAGPRISHITISARDAAWLGPHRPTTWCPNPVGALLPLAPRDIASARRWLAQTTGTHAPIWLCPSRVLRRKNLAEAMLLARLLQPDAVVATTGGVSSPAEAHYAQALAREAGSHHLHLGLLATAESQPQAAPTVAALMASSDLVVVPSLFEGFGLPVVEAAGLRAACLARRQACPDGLPPRGVHSYDEVCVPWEMCGGPAEQARQQAAWRRWRALVPSEAAGRLPEPPWWHSAAPPPFSRLTLQGQLQSLRACQTADIAAAVRTLNPMLTTAGNPAPTTLSAAANHPPALSLSSALAAALSQPTPPLATTSDPTDHPGLLDTRLEWANHYPLLWPGGDHPAD